MRYGLCRWSVDGAAKNRCRHGASWWSEMKCRLKLNKSLESSLNLHSSLHQSHHLKAESSSEQGSADSICFHYDTIYHRTTTLLTPQSVFTVTSRFFSPLGIFEEKSSSHVTPTVNQLCLHALMFRWLIEIFFLSFSRRAVKLSQSQRGSDENNKKPFRKTAAWCKNKRLIKIGSEKRKEIESWNRLECPSKGIGLGFYCYFLSCWRVDHLYKEISAKIFLQRYAAQNNIRHDRVVKAVARIEVLEIVDSTRWKRGEKM